MAWNSSRRERTSSYAGTVTGRASWCSRSRTTRRSSRGCATIPNRRFDWDAREWSAPADDWVGVRVAEILERFPELTTRSRASTEWLAESSGGGSATCATTRYDGRGWWVLDTLAGTVPAGLREGALEHDGPAARAAHGSGRPTRCASCGRRA